MDISHFSVLLAEMEAALDRRSVLAREMERQSERLLQVAQNLDQLWSARKEIKTALKDKRRFLATIEATIQELQSVIGRLNDREGERGKRTRGRNYAQTGYDSNPRTVKRHVFHREPNV